MRWLAATVVACSALACAHGSSGPRVAFEGNRALDAAALEQALKSSATDAGEPDLDRYRLKFAYYDEGYLDVQVDRGAAPDGTTVYRIREGARYRLSNLVVESEAGSPDEAAAVRAEFELADGDWFNRAKVAGGVGRVTGRLMNSGFGLADVETRLVQDPARAEVRVTILLRPGPRGVIERVEVTGAPPDQCERARQLLTVRPEQPFSRKAIRESRARLGASKELTVVDARATPSPDGSRWTVTFELLGTPR